MNTIKLVLADVDGTLVTQEEEADRAGGCSG